MQTVATDRHARSYRKYKQLTSIEKGGLMQFASYFVSNREENGHPSLELPTGHGSRFNS
jgi:hypothetical protein